MKRSRSLSPLFAVLVLASACDSSSDPSPIAGTYEATSFVVTETGEAPIDVLAEGGDLTVTIGSDNSTTGTLTVPGSLTGGADQSFSMSGTAIRSGNTVHFEQSADTFVRDMTWQIVGSDLHGTFSNGRQRRHHAYPTVEELRATVQVRGFAEQVSAFHSSRQRQRGGG